MCTFTICHSETAERRPKWKLKKERTRSCNKPLTSASFNPFPADVANKRHLGSAPKSHFCDLTGKTEVIGLPGLMTLFIDLGSEFILQTDGKSIQGFQKHTELIENRFSRLKVIQNSID